MKTSILILIMILCGIMPTTYAQNVGINDDGSTPNSNSVLQQSQLSLTLFNTQMVIPKFKQKKKLTSKGYCPRNRSSITRDCEHR